MKLELWFNGLSDYLFSKYQLPGFESIAKNYFQLIGETFPSLVKQKLLANSDGLFNIPREEDGVETHQTIIDNLDVNFLSFDEIKDPAEMQKYINVCSTLILQQLERQHNLSITCQELSTYKSNVEDINPGMEEINDDLIVTVGSLIGYPIHKYLEATIPTSPAANVLYDCVYAATETTTATFLVLPPKLAYSRGPQKPETSGRQSIGTGIYFDFVKPETAEADTDAEVYWNTILDQESKKTFDFNWIAQGLIEACNSRRHTADGYCQYSQALIFLENIIIQAVAFHLAGKISVENLIDLKLLILLTAARAGAEGIGYDADTEVKMDPARFTEFWDKLNILTEGVEQNIDPKNLQQKLLKVVGKKRELAQNLLISKVHAAHLNVKHMKKESVPVDLAYEDAAVQINEYRELLIHIGTPGIDKTTPILMLPQPDDINFTILPFLRKMTSDQVDACLTLCLLSNSLKSQLTVFFDHIHAGALATIQASGLFGLLEVLPNEIESLMHGKRGEIFEADCAGSILIHFHVYALALGRKLTPQPRDLLQFHEPHQQPSAEQFVLVFDDFGQPGEMTHGTRVCDLVRATSNNAQIIALAGNTLTKLFENIAALPKQKQIIINFSMTPQLPSSPSQKIDFFKQLTRLCQEHIIVVALGNDGLVVFNDSLHVAQRGDYRGGLSVTATLMNEYLTFLNTHPPAKGLNLILVANTLPDHSALWESSNAIGEKFHSMPVSSKITVVGIPGSGIMHPDKTTIGCGTSWSAPMVSGIAHEMLAIIKHECPDISVESANTLVCQTINTASKTHDKATIICGVPILNVPLAFKVLKKKLVELNAEKAAVVAPISIAERRQTVAARGQGLFALTNEALHNLERSDEAASNEKIKEPITTTGLHYV